MVKGTLVWATPMNEYTHLHGIIADHGHLWLIDEPALNDPTSLYFWCRSVATGAVYDWHRDELTPHKEGDVNVE